MWHDTWIVISLHMKAPPIRSLLHILFDAVEKIHPRCNNLGIATMEAGSSKGRQKVRFAPKEYFLPRRPLHVSIAVNGSCILAGLGVGMLIEKWIGLKVKEDGGYVTLGSKKEEVPETVTTAPLQQ